MIVAYIISAVCLLVDQLTKFLLYGKSCSLIGDLLWLEPGFNTGASFSMFSNATTFLIIFSIPMVVLMNYAIITAKVTKSKFFKIALFSIISIILKTKSWLWDILVTRFPISIKITQFINMNLNFIFLDYFT